MSRSVRKCIWCDASADVLFCGVVADTAVCAEHEWEFAERAVECGLRIIDKRLLPGEVSWM